MKKIIIAAAATVLLTLAVRADETTNAIAPRTVVMSDQNSGSQANQLGVGLMLGEPIGPSVKYFFTDTFAVDGALGWSPYSDTDFYIHSDALWHNYDLFKDVSSQMPLYYGVGALVRFRNSGNDNQLGVRLPVGVSYRFDNAPVDIFAEFAPNILVSPYLRGGIGGGVGLRFWF